MLKLFKVRMVNDQRAHGTDLNVVANTAETAIKLAKEYLGKHLVCGYECEKVTAECLVSTVEGLPYDRQY